MPNTRVKTISGCIEKFTNENNLYDNQHIFWQPVKKSNVRLLLNTNDFGQLGNFLRQQIKCNIFIGEETLKKYELTISGFYDNFLGGSAPSISNVVKDKDVAVSRKSLSNTSKQLSILEKPTNKAQHQPAQPSEVEEKKYVLLSGNKPELTKFFSNLESNVQLQEVYDGYKAYKKLLNKFNGQKRRMESFLNEDIPAPDGENMKQVALFEKLDEKEKHLVEPNDQSLHVEVGNEDNSLHFILSNNTKSIVPGNCTLEFSSPTSEIFRIRMGPHEIGIKGQKELRYFPSLSTPLSDYTIKVINQDGDTIFVGRCADSSDISLKSPLPSYSTGSFHTLQDPDNIFRADALSSFDELSIVSTPFLDETENSYNSGSTLSRPFTWEEI